MNVRVGKYHNNNNNKKKFTFFSFSFFMNCTFFQKGHFSSTLFLFLNSLALL